MLKSHASKEVGKAKFGKNQAKKKKCGSLIEAAVYDKNPQMLQLYEKRYQEAVASVNQELAIRRTNSFTS